MIANFGPGLREHFLLEPGMAFLNHGSYGATPKEVLAAQTEWRRRLESQPVRFMARELPPALADATVALAGFVGADPADLAFVENATSGCNAVLRSLEFAAGDELLITDHIYPAVRNTLKHVAGASGAIVVEVPLPVPLGGPDGVIAAVTARLSSRTRLVVLDLITSSTAAILPVAQIARLARKAGARVLIDAAHAPGHIDFDVPQLGAEWVTGNVHKWLFAPKGAAFLWAAPEAQADLHPPVISHGYGKGFHKEFDWVGTRDHSAWLSVPSAIEFYRRMGGRAIRAHNRDLARRAADLLISAFGTMASAAAAMRGAMATIALPTNAPATDETAEALHGRLWDRHRIEVPIMPFAGRLWLRISAQIYNEMAEYEHLAQAVKTELA